MLIRYDDEKDKSRKKKKRKEEEEEEEGRKEEKEEDNSVAGCLLACLPACLLALLTQDLRGRRRGGSSRGVVGGRLTPTPSINQSPPSCTRIFCDIRALPSAILYPYLSGNIARVPPRSLHTTPSVVLLRLRDAAYLTIHPIHPPWISKR